MSTDLATFYAEFLVSRPKFMPQQFGVDLDRQVFDGLCVDAFTATYHTWSIEELLLRPAEAALFCSDVRRSHAWLDVPDDIILRVVLANHQNH